MHFKSTVFIISLQGELWAPLPYLVMCTFALIEVTAFLLLVPETKGKPMADRMPGEDKNTEENGKLLIKIDRNSGEDVPLNDVEK